MGELENREGMRGSEIENRERGRELLCYFVLDNDPLILIALLWLRSTICTLRAYKTMCVGTLMYIYKKNTNM